MTPAQKRTASREMDRETALGYSGCTDIERFPMFAYELAFKNRNSMRRIPPPPCLQLLASQWPWVNRLVVSVITLRPLIALPKEQLSNATTRFRLEASA